jgi:hypothetical protein
LEDLSSSEQLEFAGATQALSNWCLSDPECKSFVLKHPQPSLSQIIKITTVNGSIAGAASPDQFNLGKRK